MDVASKPSFLRGLPFELVESELNEEGLNGIYEMRNITAKLLENNPVLQPMAREPGVSFGMLWPMATALIPFLLAHKGINPLESRLWRSLARGLRLEEGDVLIETLEICRNSKASTSVVIGEETLIPSRCEKMTHDRYEQLMKAEWFLPYDGTVVKNEKDVSMANLVVQKLNQLLAYDNSFLVTIEPNTLTRGYLRVLSLFSCIKIDDCWAIFTLNHACVAPSQELFVNLLNIRIADLVNESYLDHRVRIMTSKTFLREDIIGSYRNELLPQLLEKILASEEKYKAMHDSFYVDMASHLKTFITSKKEYLESNSIPIKKSYQRTSLLDTLPYSVIAMCEVCREDIEPIIKNKEKMQKFLDKIYEMFVSKETGHYVIVEHGDGYSLSVGNDYPFLLGKVDDIVEIEYGDNDEEINMRFNLDILESCLEKMSQGIVSYQCVHMLRFRSPDSLKQRCLARSFLHEGSTCYMLYTYEDGVEYFSTLKELASSIASELFPWYDVPVNVEYDASSSVRFFDMGLMAEHEIGELMRVICDYINQVVN